MHTLTSLTNTVTVRRGATPTSCLCGQNDEQATVVPAAGSDPY